MVELVKKKKSTNFVLNETLTTSATKSYNLILDFKIFELPPRILNKLEIYFLIKMRRPLRDHFFIKRPVLILQVKINQKPYFYFYISTKLENLSVTRYCYNSKVKPKYLTLEGWSSGLRL